MIHSKNACLFFNPTGAWLAIAFLHSCSMITPEQKANLESLGQQATRKEVYRIFPPSAEPNLLTRGLFNASGERGSESYPIGEKQRLTYSALYANTSLDNFTPPENQQIIDSVLNNPERRAFNRHITSPDDLLSGFRIEKNQNSSTQTSLF